MSRRVLGRAVPASGSRGGDASGTAAGTGGLERGPATIERKKRGRGRQTQPHQAFRGCHCGARRRNGSAFLARICGRGSAAVRERRTATRQISAKASNDRPDEQAATAGNAVL